MTVGIILPSLNFSLVTNNDDMIQINPLKRSDGLPPSIQSAQWEMFNPGTRTAIVTKTGSDILIVPVTYKGIVYPIGSVKFLIEHTDTAPDGPPGLTPGEYPHELTVITTDGRIHTVTQGDIDLTAGIVTIRDILTPPPS